jgi:ribosome-binding protein aMBF1 (putative translation factor)
VSNRNLPARNRPDGATIRPVAAPAPGGPPQPTASAEAAGLRLAADLLDRWPAVFTGWRLTAGLSRAEAATAVGASPSTIARWETARAHPSGPPLVAALRLIADTGEHEGDTTNR